MKTCNITNEQLMDFLLNEQSEDSRSEIEEHIKGCSDCQNRLNVFSDLKEAWDEPNFSPLSDSFLDNIMEQLLEAEKKPNKAIFHYFIRSSFFHFSVSSTAAFLLFFTGTFHRFLIWTNYFSNFYSNSTNQFYLLSGKGLAFLNEINVQFSHWLHIF